MAYKGRHGHALLDTLITDAALPRGGDKRWNRKGVALFSVLIGVALAVLVGGDVRRLLPQEYAATVATGRRCSPVHASVRAFAYDLLLLRSPRIESSVISAAPHGLNFQARHGARSAISCLGHTLTSTSRHPTKRSPRPLAATADVQEAVTGLPRYEPGALSEFVVTSAGVQMPRMIFRTACKDESTEALTKCAESSVLGAVRAGFHGIDTAFATDRGNTEPGVGAALASLFASGVERDSLFIQTKVNADYYQEGADISKQVQLSILDSLSDLGLDYVDSLILHWPSLEHDQTMEAWRAMEDAVQAGLVRQIGISNVATLEALQKVYADATLKPAVFQARAAIPFSQPEVPAWCVEQGVYFQSFGLPSEYREPIASKTMQDLAEKYGVTPVVVFLRFAMGIDIMPVVFTQSDDQMSQNLLAPQIPLTPEDAEKIDELLEQLVGFYDR
eukprot:gnl/TRDRNA2_/TRDRNA2_116188_c2_seq4.p1 gnl/TRDRNA2_/TRDRNA2_116188_c2~~gnl/TRDRNA2_/TRDRNA2_116188_c2_seq4.p1  ORF type:complete len:447 (+),score=66.89 gnl/TRDRNA2_/TRDRNA2_116188_c2_seq4:103-1443(+)